MATALQSVRFRGKWFTLAEAHAHAIKQLNRRNFPVALEIYDLILTKVPDDAVIHYHRGLALHGMGEVENSLESFMRAVELNPTYAEAWCTHGAALVSLQRAEEALASFEKGLALKPDYAEGHFNKANTLATLRRFKEAVAEYDKAIGLRPDYVEAIYYRGKSLLIIGDMAAAEATFRALLKLNPNHSESLVALSGIRNDHNDEEIARLQALIASPDLKQDDKAQLYFGLGKIYDDCERYDEAFESYAQANRIFSSRVSYDPVEETRMTDKIISVFDRKFLAEPFAFASDDPTPVFIVGMNRSGTTLLATMLSNHPSIASAGELDKMNDLALGLSQLVASGASYPEAAREITPEIGQKIIQEYLTLLRRDVDPLVRHVLDKLPLNFRHLGLIAKLFPKAVVIHCIRNPLDTGLSNYFQQFSPECNFSNDLRNFGHYYLEYTKLMEHWRSALPSRMLEVTYDDMVLKTEAVARTCLERLGLPFDERCTSPHLNAGPVETSSFWQVRQPIYKKSLARWRKYEKHLAPLRQMLPPL